jgi:hypothetical protein
MTSIPDPDQSILGIGGVLFTVIDRTNQLFDRAPAVWDYRQGEFEAGALRGHRTVRFWLSGIREASLGGMCATTEP